MAAEKKCCVSSCGKTREQNTILHNFPNPEKENERFKLWITAVGGDMLKLDHNYIFKYRRVCHQHFETRFYTSSRRLSANAYPTLFQSGTGTSVIQPLQDITNTPTLRVDHVVPSTSTGIVHNIGMETQVTKSTGSRTNAVSSKFCSTIKDFTRIINKLKKKNDKFSTRLKKAMKLSENSTFQNCLKKFTSLAAIFTIMQFREVKNKKMARRFTREEKILALSLYKQGPKAYRWLKKIFILPSPVTLNRLISKASIKAGFNKNIFNQLKKNVEKLKSHDKLCILLFDEISITPHFDYNRRKDFISGFVNNGRETRKQIADHALVFMVRGVMKNYKQPIAYTFCSGSTAKEDLKILIKQMIKELQNCGLTVVATVCDQGAGNVWAINKLIEENRVEHIKHNNILRNKTFEVNGQEVVPLFDVPHLMKGIRNNLLTKNLKFELDNETKLAKWEHIKLLHTENPEYKGIRLLHHLTEAHVNPKKIPKMKVKYATQVFSRSVALHMGYLAEKKILPYECRNTADLLMFFDELFDSFNGSLENSKKRIGKELLGPVTPKSKHFEIWTKAKKVLKSMQFLTDGGKVLCVPSISNWLHTVENMKYLIIKLRNEYDINSVWMRHFNQDPLENFFGCIRSHGCRNVSPTPAGFEAAFTSLLINNLSSNHSPGANCEMDSCSVFKSMINILEIDDCKEMNIEIDFDDVDFACANFEIKMNNPRISAQLHYVAGYLLRQAKKYVYKNCKECQENVFNKNKDNEYLNLREYHNQKKWLIYPNKNVVSLISDLQELSNHVLEKKSHIIYLKEYIKTVMLVIANFKFLTCSKHKNELQNYILDLGSRFFIYNWCKENNKLLKGTRLLEYENDDVKKMCRDYYNKRNKS